MALNTPKSVLKGVGVYNNSNPQNNYYTPPQGVGGANKCLYNNRHFIDPPRTPHNANYSDGVVIVVDTREKRRLDFGRIPSETHTLAQGDYSALGLETTFAIERKSLSDLVGTLMGHKILKDGSKRFNYDRFLEEMERLKDYHHKAVIVTAPWDAFTHNEYRCRAPHFVILRKIKHISRLYRIPFIWLNNSIKAARFVVAAATIAKED